METMAGQCRSKLVSGNDRSPARFTALGERWGRYWLDLAGYADSEGGVSNDPIREVAWKYRDYVIDAFNNDKPYDRFLLEQIAGDELLDCEKDSIVTEEMVENLTATGFLQMGIDQTGSRPPHEFRSGTTRRRQ